MREETPAAARTASAERERIRRGIAAWPDALRAQMQELRGYIADRLDGFAAAR